MSRPRALIADDEPLARRRLRELLEPETWLDVVGETADGASTIREIERLRPDLVFLDIRMPGASGLEVVERASHVPHVIFTTAFDRYAVTAFELQAVDYLLKPFGDERFRLALSRARQVLERPARPLSRFFVRQRGRIVAVPLEELLRIEAQDDYVMLHTAEGRHLIKLRMKVLERALDPARFLRVHRSHIVSLDHVRAVEPGEAGRLELLLTDGSRVPASRSRSPELRRLVRD